MDDADDLIKTKYSRSRTQAHMVQVWLASDTDSFCQTTIGTKPKRNTGLDSVFSYGPGFLHVGRR